MVFLSLTFFTGEGFFRPKLQNNHADDPKIVKETLKLLLVPAFTLDKNIQV
jgi:hypothetical protein